MAIYYLDVDDEITSAAARIRGSVDTRIALVLPGGSRVATSRINFKLLEREAKQRNKQLSIVAPDASVRSLAQSAGMPVFATVREYEAAEAARPRGAGPAVAGATTEAPGELAATLEATGRDPGSARRGVPVRGGATPGDSGSQGLIPSAEGAGGRTRRRRLGVASLVLIGLVAIIVAAGAFAAYQLWPSATVVLTVHEKPLGPLSLSVNIDPSIVAVNYAALSVPGITKSFDVTESDTFTATGQSVVETAATGTATFSSINTVSSVPLPAGTTISTAGGIAFKTTAGVSVPIARVSGTTITRGVVDVPIQAASKGTSGNVGSNTIVRLPADLIAGGVTVTNHSPTTGGTHKVTPVVQQSDLDKATDSLTKSVNDGFTAALANPGELPSGVLLFADTGRLGKITLDPDPTTLLNKQVASFQLTAQATGTATEADTASVRSLAESRITSKVQSGYILVDGSVNTSMGAPTAHGSVVSIPVTANAAEAATVSVDVLKANIEGKSVKDARAYLLQFGDATISLSPWWASSVPAYDFRIDLTLVAPNSHPGSSPSPVKTPGSTAAASASTPSQTASGSGEASPSASTSASSSASTSASSSSSESSSPSETPSAKPSPSAS